MILGVVNDALEATLRLQVIGPQGQMEITAVIDTGYNGSLTLPAVIVAALVLPPLTSRSVTLGDASRRLIPYCEATVLWNGQARTIPVMCVEGVPLLGAALLKGFKMEADFVAGGAVKITELP